MTFLRIAKFLLVTTDTQGGVAVMCADHSGARWDVEITPVDALALRRKLDMTIREAGLEDPTIMAQALEKYPGLFDPAESS